MESNQFYIKEEIDFNDVPLKSISKDVDAKIIVQFAENKESFEEIMANNVLNEPLKIDVGKEWIEEFQKRIKDESKSKKVKYTIDDALFNTTLHSQRDRCFILAYNYLKENPPERNDFIKYLSVYNESGEKLKSKYFKYDLEILNKYYEKADEKKKEGDLYNPFNIKAYRNYVFYMVLKLRGEYIDSDDMIFDVSTKDNREYNPATKIPSILRGFLPIYIKEYDIKRAFPTFIDIELGTNYRNECYEKLDKKTFAKALNANSSKRNDDYYYKCIEDLEKIYGIRAYEVLTPERFSEKGRTFRDFTKYEKEFIEQFIKENYEL